MDSITLDVMSCARCGKNHESVEFKKLDLPIITKEEITFTHWAPCPFNGEPILLFYIK